MNIAVLTLTRDRLDYTKHTFAKLAELGGVPFDHYVLDNGSQDGTVEWLREYDPPGLILEKTNVGISRGLNKLLSIAIGYDVIVKIDNDCELVTEGSLRDCAELVAAHPDWLLSPRILGLNSPMPLHGEKTLDSHRVGLPPIIGGIFLAANADLYRGGYRHNEGNPPWGMDDVSICHETQRRGGHVGYLLNHEANHFQTTNGQRARYPDYFARKDAEFAGA